MKVVLILAVIFGFLVVLEVALRSLFGFGNPLTYIADETIGYLLAPNQSTKRFGNRIEINQYSMRSGATTKERPADAVRILLLGDSVANGGWWTDQQDTISVMLTEQLRRAGERKRGGEGEKNPQAKIALSAESRSTVEVLNASANSWGPRNELAYLQKFGSFEAQTIVLLLNTDDLFAMAPDSWAVGNDRNYPAHKPPLAIWEVVSRYLLPESKAGSDRNEPGDRVGFNLEAIRQVNLIAQQSNSRFVLAMTPLLREIGSPGPRDYEQKARKRLLEFAETEQIAYLDFLPIFNQSVEPAKLYRDHIHLSPAGNRLVSEQLNQHIQISG